MDIPGIYFKQDEWQRMIDPDVTMSPSDEFLGSPVTIEDPIKNKKVSIGVQYPDYCPFEEEESDYTPIYVTKLDFGEDIAEGQIGDYTFGVLYQCNKCHRYTVIEYDILVIYDEGIQIADPIEPYSCVYRNKYPFSNYQKNIINKLAPKFRDCYIEGTESLNLLAAGGSDLNGPRKVTIETGIGSRYREALKALLRGLLLELIYLHANSHKESHDQLIENKSKIMKFGLHSCICKFIKLSKQYDIFSNTIGYTALLISRIGNKLVHVVDIKDQKLIYKLANDMKQFLNIFVSSVVSNDVERHVNIILKTNETNNQYSWDDIILSASKYFDKINKNKNK